MDKLGKYPKEIFILLICYIVGIFVDLYIVYGNILREKPLSQIIFIALPSLLLIIMIFLLHIRKKWAYVALWIMYFPISLCGWAVAIVYIILPNPIFPILMIVCGINTIKSMISKSVKYYFMDNNNCTIQ